MMRTLALLIATALLAGVTSAEAIHWTGNGDGSSWEDGANWDLNHQPTGVDDVYMDSGTADVTTSDAVLNRFQSGGTVNINSGGVLTGSNGYTLRYITLINVNNGGSLPRRPAGMFAATSPSIRAACSPEQTTSGTARR